MSGFKVFNLTVTHKMTTLIVCGHSVSITGGVDLERP